MYHPNIKKETGEICLNVFSKDWVPTMKLSDIIEKIISLLLYPNFEFPVEEEIANEYQNNYEKWKNNVKEFNKKYHGKKLSDFNNKDNDNFNKDNINNIDNGINKNNNDNFNINNLNNINFDNNNNFNINNEINISEDINKININPKNEEEDYMLAIKLSEEEEKRKLEYEEKLKIAINESLKEKDNNIDNIEKEKNKNEIKNQDEEFDEKFGICPITLDYMENPVICPSGNYYEKSAIIEWIKQNGTEPLTRQKLSVDMLIEDNECKKKIIEFRKKFNK